MDNPQNTCTTESEEDVLCFYFVAFLDVMGQSDRWEGLTDFPQNEKEIQEANRIVGETVGFLRLFRNTFEDFVTGYLGNTEQVVSESEEAQEVLGGPSALFEFRFVSDSIIVSAPLAGNDEHCSAVRRVFLAFTGTVAAVVTSLARHQMIRGGLDVGLGVEVAPKEVYGPALISAYRLESKEADWPRVLIGDSLWSFLQHVKCQQPQTARGVAAQKFAELCISMIATDQEDGRKILDYLAKPIADFQADSREQFINTTFKAAYSFVREQPEKCQRATNPKVLERASRLLRYFESRVETWSLSGNIVRSPR